MVADLPRLTSVPELRHQVAQWRQQGCRIALVPTMGALHEGHLSLVRRGLELADRVIISIFVNPMQFGPNEDFSAYPRQQAEDIAKLAQAGAHGVFLPSVTDMYPPGFVTSITVAKLSDGLCGEVRPGHFSGVATVVAKLLLQAAPDSALFGEKDYQQLQVIRRLVKDLDIPVVIEAVPTVREQDGLAMSSRNAYLTPQERGIAPALFSILSSSVVRLQAGEKVATVLDEAPILLLKAGFQSVDYLELRSADDLQPMTRLNQPGRLLAVARLGKARLLDNLPVMPG